MADINVHDDLYIYGTREVTSPGLLFPLGTDPLNAPDHALSHRVITHTENSPDASIGVDDDGNTSLGSHSLYLETLKFGTTPTIGSTTDGELYWDQINRTLSLITDTAAGVSLQVGQENFVRIVNKTGVQINDGEAVYISGAQGNRPTVALARANSLSTTLIIGIATQDIAINAEGNITVAGVVNGFDTSDFAAGDALFVSAATPGVIVNTAPVSPNYVAQVGYALNSANNGKILVIPRAVLAGDVAFGANSNMVPPTQAAVKAYIAASSMPMAMTTDTNNPTGFLEINDGVNTADTTLAFDTATKIFTLGKVNATFSFYAGGVKWTKSADQQVDLTSIWAVNTIFYIYESALGVLSAMTTEWDITGNAAPVATVVWNGTAAFPLISDERHGAKRNNAWHEWAHDNIGSQITGSGFEITTLNSTSSIITGGVISDEDIHTSVSTQTDSLRIVYVNGSTTTYADTLSATSALIIGGALKYEAAGTITSVSDGYFIRNTIVVSNIQNSGGPIAVRVAQTQHNNINDARNSNPPTSTTYLSNETRQIYSAIWQNLGGTPTLVEYTDFRSAPTLPNGFVAKTPMWLDSIQDVATPSPVVDDVLKWNGLNWINGSGAVVSGSAGIDFYLTPPQIVALSGENSFPIHTFSKTPVTQTSSTVTMTSANPGVFTLVNHGYVAGTNVVFTTDGALPTNIVAGTTYFVITAGLTSTQFQVSATLGGAAVNTTAGVQSGTHTITTAERLISGTVSAANVATAIAGFLYDTAIGRTALDAGLWTFTNWAGMSSTAGTNFFNQNVYTVVDDANTITTTNLTGTSKTATASGGTPFAGLAASYATALVAPYLRTPKGLYRILTVSSDTVCTILVPGGYSNETDVAFGLWTRVVPSTTSADLSTTTPTYTSLESTVASSSIAIATTTKLGTIIFVTSDNTGRTMTVTYSGTARSGHISTPLVTLHNNLAGLEGGGATERYHITAAEATVVANTSGTNTGDNSANSNVGLVHISGAESITGIKTFDKDTIKLKGTSTGVVILSNAGTTGTDFTAIMQAKDGTVALTSDITGTNSNTNTGDQTIANSSDATSHTITLSASGGSMQLVEGSNITLTTTGTGSAGIVTIAATSGGGLTWSAVTSNGTMVVDTGTLANKGSLLELTLPATSAVGKVVRVAGMNAGLWKIVQAAGQYIKYGNQASTIGVTGYISSVLTYDAVELVCIEADLGWVVVSSIGNITVA